MSAEELREAVASATETPAGNGACDAGPDWRAEVARLASLPPIEADREMKACAKALSCRATILQSEVAKARGEQVSAVVAGAGRPLELPEPEPWPEPVPGGTMLDELERALERHVVMPPEGRRGVVLWIVLTYVLEHASHAPRLLLKSPEKRCGKSTLLRFLASTCRRPLPASNASTAALFRAIELLAPTLLLDEADTYMRENEELRGLVNSGHERSFAYVLRTVEIDGQHEPRMFSTWCAMAIAGIGGQHGTIEDRSVIVEMRRKLTGEVVARLDGEALPTLETLARKAARWAADEGHRIGTAKPSVPAELNDRAADSWRPLLAIADAAGGDWPEKARKAAAALSGADGEDSLATELLADIRALFAAADEAKRTGVEKLPSTFVVGELIKLEHRPWPELPRTGKPLTARKMAVLLGRFGIAPEHNREGNVYHRAHFADAFERYLSGLDPADEPSQPSQGSRIKDLSESESFTRGTGREASGPAKDPGFSRPVKVVKVQPRGDPAPPWDDLDAWRLPPGAADLEAQRAVVLEWARAAGGTVNGHGFTLPPDLPRGLALAELRSAAQRCGLTVEEPVLQPFVPARDWQEVPQGTILPAGLEIQMNMAGGATFARLKPDEPEGFDL